MKALSRGWVVLLAWVVWPPGYLLASILYWALPDQCAVDSCGPPVPASSKFQIFVAQAEWVAWCVGAIALPLLLTGVWWRRRRAGKPGSDVQAA